MTQHAFKLGRRSLIIGTGALFAAGAAGIWAWSSADHRPLSDIPAGWYLLSQPGLSDGERQLVVRHSQRFTEQVLETEYGTRFLSAAISPDARTLALLKRVPRGSMPTDALALYDTASFRRLSVVELQIAFQRIPTFNVGWSADGSRLIVSYDLAGRSLLFRVDADHKLSLQSMISHASFQFHPQRPDRALYTATPSEPDQVSMLQLTSSMQEQVIETFVGREPQWSPDGTKLAYLDLLGAKKAPRLVVRDEVSRQRAAMLIDVERHTWSADSHRLAVYGLVDSDPLEIRSRLPDSILPYWQPPAAQSQLFIYDTLSTGLRSIGPLRPGFQLAHLQWLDGDWLLVMDVQANQSFIVDRRGERRVPVTGLDNYTPLIRWIPQRDAA